MITILIGNDIKTESRSKKGISLLEVCENYVVLDLETTGLDPSYDDIIEVAALRIENNEIVGQYQSLVNPGYKISEFISNLTGITNEMLSKAPHIQDVLKQFIDFIGDSIVVGHNANFDINFLYDNCSRNFDMLFKNNFIDTMRLSRRLFKKETHHRLSDLVMRFGIGPTIEHRALNDAHQTHECYQYMLNYITANSIDINLLYPHRSNLLARDICATAGAFDESSPIFGKTFVFTGALERMTRREAMQLVVNKGGFCEDNVNKKTNYLILANNEYCTSIKDGKSNKQKKAEQLKLSGMDIEIISERVFYDMLTE
ncbi:MAG: exonuclease domain-containing protein [Bacillota bacterium]|nr:exonuclease domain-containing protein [Bacillota bacterium]